MRVAGRNPGCPASNGFLRCFPLPSMTLECRADDIELVLEHGAAGRGKATRLRFILKRDFRWQLTARIVC